MALTRSRSLQIYMKPGIKEDDVLLRVWEACRRLDRPQDVFRSMLRAGLVAMVESGEMPDSVIEECGLEAILERRRRRARRGAQEAQPFPPYFPPHPPAYPYQPPLPPFQVDAGRRGAPSDLESRDMRGEEERPVVREAPKPASMEAQPEGEPGQRQPPVKAKPQSEGGKRIGKLM